MRSLLIGFGAVALLASGGLCPAVAGSDEKKPNVLFIMADDLGWADVQPYGSTFHDTPNLSRLARRR